MINREKTRGGRAPKKDAFGMLPTSLFLRGLS